MKDVFEIIPAHGFVIPSDYVFPTQCVKRTERGRPIGQRNFDSARQDGIVAVGKAKIANGETVSNVAVTIEPIYYRTRATSDDTRQRRLKFLRLRLLACID